MTISEKSAIVENSFTSVCNSASRFARNLSVFDHHHDLVEEPVDRRTQLRNLQQRVFVFLPSAQPFHTLGRLRNLRRQFLLSVFVQGAGCIPRRVTSLPASLPAAGCSSSA